MPSHAPAKSGWQAVCQVDELPPGERKLVTVNGVEIALFNIDGAVFAINNCCPHRKGPLIRGYIDGEGGIKCPMHGWRFDLRTGQSRRPAQATTYRTKIKAGTVCLTL
jgi:nitrite reductase/ring-hydroxylating ferredoxin subunit